LETKRSLWRLGSLYTLPLPRSLPAGIEAFQATRDVTDGCVLCISINKDCCFAQGQCLISTDSFEARCIRPEVVSATVSFQDIFWYAVLPQGSQESDFQVDVPIINIVVEL
jgi:hypothetical protein